MTSAAPQLTVIVPAFKCAPMLRACLDGLLASDLPRDEWELIVVDDSSPDETPDVARTVADLVLTTPNGPRGPAFARNLAAVRARAPLLLFVDSDVVVAPHTLSGFVHIFATHPDVVAASGAYDLHPGDDGFVSQYRNLLHHYVHRIGAGEASTFWAGCGAVRRDAFLRVGGYDARRYPRPQIEDIELGYRLDATGERILLVPELQGSHLKRWTFRNMVRTDFRERAVPWMHLILDRGESIADGPLNLAFGEKILTALAGVSVLALMTSLATLDSRWLAIAGVATIVQVMANAPLFAWFAEVRGEFFALRVIPLRLLYYFISGFGAAWAIASYRRRPQFAPLPPLTPATDGTTDGAHR